MGSNVKTSNSLFRTCIGCKQKKLMAEMIRFNFNNGKLGVGTGLRGAWLCRESTACIQLAVKGKAFDRAFRSKLSVSLAAINELINSK
jgi:predicted RNA-binding protein YlxR (DUF448 family)